MSAFPYLVLLFGFVGLGVYASGAVTSPTPNPECPGMHRVAKSLEKGLKTYTKETTICRVNSACTGLMCNGTHKQNDFYMKMEIRHCKTPPTIHLDLVYKKINVHREMKDGQIKISSRKTPLGTAPIELKLTLKKNRNRITTGLEVQVCALGCTTLFTLLPPTTFCLNMKTCPGYNPTGDIPCHLNPSGNPMSTMTSTSSPHSSGQLSSTTKQSSSTRPRTYSPTQHSGLMTVGTVSVPSKVIPAKHSSSTASTLRSSTIKPTQHSAEPTKLVPTRGPIRTLRSSIKPSTQHVTGLMTTVSVPTKVIPAKHSSSTASTLRSSTIKPTQHSAEPTKLVPTRGPIRTLRSSIKPSTQHVTAKPGDTHALKRESGHDHISVGVAIGIGFACIVGILIIAGAAFYWKKFYRRSRLRAAYYNDISMNDPLYEDFGPEMA